MMNLLASAFTGFAMLFGGLFGHHAAPNATSTPPEGDRMMGTSTPWANHMGSTTPMGGGGIFGKVTDISGSSITVVGKSIGAATTTYAVDASAAKVLKAPTKGFASSTPSTVASIAVGDNVLVIGTVSGTSVTAKTIIDGLAIHPGVLGMPAVMRGRMGSSTIKMHRPVPQGSN